MVCFKCQKKLDKLITPDSWKEGSRNTTGGKDGGRKIGVNMLLEKKKFKSSFFFFLFKIFKFQKYIKI